jgi:hypothetical protein
LRIFPSKHLWLLAALFLLLGNGNVHAQTLFETLVLPGPVVKGHAEFEAQCAKCHEPMSRQSQSGLCLECHKPVATDRQQARGFHGRNASAAKLDCKQCHTDHKGRDATIVQLDRETFNHGQTNFELKGRHRNVQCDGCHLPLKPMRAAPGRCAVCHKAVEPHKGRLGDNCASCHTEDGWGRPKPFDHSATKFPLVGAHQKVVCASCHIGERYKDLPSSCAACHSIQDKHAGRYGQKCETCHRPETWSAISFNHDKATRFPLRGRHAMTKCDTCHTGALYRDKLATTCVSCHSKDDPHKGQLGGRCDQCHLETGWRKKATFDHDVTKFPLIGKHSAVPCEECHRSQRYKETPQACSSCHKDVRHLGRLGTGCATCHNPNGWKRWRFDHTSQTRYPLTGAHQNLDCHACHQSKIDGKIALSTTCVSCHSADDAHSGSFGRNCEQCHTTVTFKQRAVRK